MSILRGSAVAGRVSCEWLPLTLLVMGFGNVVDMNVNGLITGRALGPLSGVHVGAVLVTQTPLESGGGRLLRVDHQRPIAGQMPVSGWPCRPHAVLEAFASALPTGVPDG